MTESRPTRTAKTRAKASAARSRARAVSRNHASGFVNFIREQGVIGLAIGLAIGAAAGATVKVLVESFVNPVVQFIVGTGGRLESGIWHIEFWGRTADFKWGAALSSLITLLATALAIYLAVHMFKLDRLDKKKD